MSNPNRIESGDVVNIGWPDGGTMLHATVVHAAVAGDDVWAVRAKDGALVYIQQFDVMTLVSKCTYGQVEKGGGT